jgi:hypothetical protein
MAAEQQQINYGSQPNDGQGDPLRTAFIKTDDNFSNIWAAGPVGSNITISDTTVTVDTVNGSLVLNPNGIGNVVVNRTVLPNFDNTHNLGSPGSRFRSAFVGSGGVVASGNITAPYFIGDGSQLTGIGSNYGNANVVTLLADLGSNSVSTTGNVTAGYVLGNGSQLTGLPSGYGNSDVAAYLPGYTGNLSGGNLTITSSGNVWTVAGRQITGPGGTYWFTNPAQSLAIFSGGPGENLRIQSLDANSITQTRVTLTDTYAEVFVENGVNHAWRFQESGSFDAAGSIVPVVSLATTEYTLGNAASPWTGVYSTGNSFLGNIEVTGDIIPSANVTYSLGNSTNYWSNLWIANNTIYIGGVPLGVSGNVLTVDGQPVLSNDSSSSITTTGNITANYFIGDGSQLTNLPFDASIIVNGNSQIDIPVADSNIYVGVNGIGSIEFTVEGVNALNLRSLGNVTGVTGNITGNLAVGTDGNTNVLTVKTEAGVISIGNQLDGTFVITDPNFDPSIQVAGQQFYITTNDNSYQFTFGVNGSANVAFPGNLNLGDGADSDIFNSSNNISITANTASWTFDTSGDLTVPNYIYFKDGTFIGDEGGAGTPVFRVDSPLGLGINLTTDSDISGNNYTWSFGIDGVLTAPGAVTATGNVVGGNLITTGNVVGNVSGFAIGYRDIPQVSFTGDAIISTIDAGKHFYSTESTDYILTIANNASQGFAVGAAISVVNQGTGNITVAQGSGVTLYLAGNATSGNRTISTFGMATIMKVAIDTWFINGTGVA